MWSINPEIPLTLLWQPNRSEVKCVSQMGVHYWLVQVQGLINSKSCFYGVLGNVTSNNTYKFFAFTLD